MVESLLLGVVQGLTEFIPVSSTAHLVLLHALLGSTGPADSLAFDVALHFGTTAALVGFFWNDWIDILRNQRALLYRIAAGTVPVAVAGLGARHLISGALRSPALIAAMLVLFGMVMIASERFRSDKPLHKMTVRDALLIGAAQALAVVPGVSRSGVAISAGLFAGYGRSDAARFAFLLSTPAVLGAALLESRDIWQGLDAAPAVFAAGFVGSLLAGFAALGFLMRYLQSHRLHGFAYYRFALAAAIVAALFFRG